MRENKLQLLFNAELYKIGVESVNTCMQQYLINMTKELNSMPKGSLYLRYRNGNPNFSAYLNGKTIGITNKPSIVYQLARRRFLLAQVSLIKQLLETGWVPSCFDSISKGCEELEAMLSSFQDAGLDLDRIVMTPNQQIWNSNRHSQKYNRREGLIYPTKGRIYMRSKSEQAIGNLLESLHIPYRYEPRLRINNIDYHPDFLIMLPTDQLVILEHVGRMDLTQYNEGFIARLQAYDSANLLIGRNVFLSFEHDTKDEELIMKVILQILTSKPMDNKYLIYTAKNAGCQIDLPSPRHIASHRR